LSLAATPDTLLKGASRLACNLPSTVVFLQCSVALLVFGHRAFLAPLAIQLLNRKGTAPNALVLQRHYKYVCWKCVRTYKRRSCGPIALAHRQGPCCEGGGGGC